MIGFVDFPQMDNGVKFFKQHFENSSITADDKNVGQIKHDEFKELLLWFYSLKGPSSGKHIWFFSVQAILCLNKDVKEGSYLPPAYSEYKNRPIKEVMMNVNLIETGRTVIDETESFPLNIDTSQPVGDQVDVVVESTGPADCGNYEGSSTKKEDIIHEKIVQNNVSEKKVGTRNIPVPSFTDPSNLNDDIEILSTQVSEKSESPTTSLSPQDGDNFGRGDFVGNLLQNKVSEKKWNHEHSPTILHCVNAKQR